MASWTAALLLGSSCAVETSGLRGVDAGMQPAGEAGMDARNLDASNVDAAEGDAAPADDAGPARPDAGSDAGPPAAPDAGPPDAGPPDAGPPDCRTMPESCGTPGGYGAGCTAPEDCWSGLECCTDDRCGGRDPIGGTCTVTGCGSDGETDSCPLDMICYHGICFFPCGPGFRCPHSDQQCDHSSVCEWG